MQNQPLKLSDLIALQAENAKAQYLKPVTKIKPLDQIPIPNIPQPAGGKRTGAGRPKTAEATTVVRVPTGCLAAVQKLIAEYRQSPTLIPVTEIKPPKPAEWDETAFISEMKEEGVYWLDKNRQPLVRLGSDERRIVKIRYVYCGMEWSGRGRLPPVIDRFVTDNGNNRGKALEKIDQMMREQGYIWIGD